MNSIPSSGLNGSSIVYKIQKKNSIKRSIDIEHNVLNSIRDKDFKRNVEHLWSIKMPDNDREHIILFTNENDAANMVTAMNMYYSEHSGAGQNISRYIDFHNLCNNYYYKLLRSPDKKGVRPQHIDYMGLHKSSCELDDIYNWATTRNIALMVISRMNVNNVDNFLHVMASIYNPIINDEEFLIDQFRRNNMGV